MYNQLIQVKANSGNICIKRNLLLKSCTYKLGFRDYIRFKYPTKNIPGVTSGIHMFRFPYICDGITYKIYKSLNKDLALVNKDERLLVSSAILTNLFSYFDNLINFDKNECKNKITIKIDKKIKYIDDIYKYFTENEDISVEEYDVNEIFELYDTCEFLLIDEEFEKYVKYIVLYHISHKIQDWDYYQLSKANQTIFDCLLDIEVLLTYQKYVNKEINNAQLFSTLNNLIIDSKRELEYVKYY